MANTIKVTLTRSTIGKLKRHKACAAGLGLKKIRQTVEVIDTPATRGMINKISYMVALAEHTEAHTETPVNRCD